MSVRTAHVLAKNCRVTGLESEAGVQAGRGLSKPMGTKVERDDLARRVRHCGSEKLPGDTPVTNGLLDDHIFDVEAQSGEVLVRDEERHSTTTLS